MLANLGIFLLTPFLATSSFMGFGVDNDNYAFAQANSSSNRPSESRAATFGNWGWGDRFERGPMIRSISPDEGDVGTEVTLKGARFTEDSIVRMGDGAIHDVEVSRNGRTLSFMVPEYMGMYCPPDQACTMIAYEVEPGNYDVRVVTGEKTSNAVEFTVTEDVENPGDELSIDSIDGPTKLVVDEEGTWTVNVVGADSDLRYSVKWGDERLGLRSLFSSDDNGQASATFTHVYDESGTYTPEFTVTNEEGDVVTKSAAQVTVGEDGSVYIESIIPASAEAGQRVSLTGHGFDGETKVWVGGKAGRDVQVEDDSHLSFVVPDLVAKNYRVKVTSDEGESNVVALEVKAKIKAKVSVSGVDAPTRLVIDQEGTWTVHASSNTEGNLRYSVDWGEGSMMLRSASEESTQSSATFTHSYSSAGTYHPKFTVTDVDSGKSASVSASVIVK